MSRDIPIIFSAPMVRALLDGRKTQTRRLAWHDPKPVVAHTNKPPKRARPLELATTWQKVKPGDRLWVRESIAFKEKGLVAYAADGRTGAWIGDGGGGAVFLPHGYVSGHPQSNTTQRGHWTGLGKHGGKWRPSIHMPRWASRLTLEVTAVKVERLQDISEDDAQAEGIAPYVPDSAIKQGPSWYRLNFRDLWKSLHGPESWDANPEVACLSFKVHKANIDALARAA